jgi:UDP-3-O-[3-hydroxymyristoyl] N-acetylglucosamine deacetylase
LLDLHPFRQRTCKQRATLAGIGLHTGARVQVTLCPGPANSGILFERTDLDRRVEIPALADFVVDTTLNTSLGRDGQRVGTVEHLMAALAGCGIDNARIEVHGPEIPIVDGSSAPFVELIREAGIRQQNATRRYLHVRRPIVVRDGDKLARLSPARSFSIQYTVDFRHPLITDQRFGLEVGERAFQKEIARARTFGFVRDVERLRALGLAKGGSLENAIVIDDYNVLNPEGLRFPDEFVRHKILDAIGDLALLGMPVIGHFEAVKSGHALNREVARRALLEAGATAIVRPRAEQELSELHERVPSFAGLETA